MRPNRKYNRPSLLEPMAATPIPRTLEMSLTGIRDLSLLNTPPSDRQPIFTYVGEYDEKAAVEAIRRELLREGQVFFVHNRVADIEQVAQGLKELGYKILATTGTADYLLKGGVEVGLVNKVKEGSPHCVEMIESKKIDLVINTTFGEQAIEDSFSLRRSSLNQNLPYCTTIAGASALLGGLKTMKEESLGITAIQEYHIS